MKKPKFAVGDWVMWNHIKPVEGKCASLITAVFDDKSYNIVACPDGQADLYQNVKQKTLEKLEYDG